MWEQIYGFNTATKAYVLTLINSVHGNLSTQEYQKRRNHVENVDINVTIIFKLTVTEEDVKACGSGHGTVTGSSELGDELTDSISGN